MGVAKGKRAKGLVLAGKREKTVGGLKASNLFRNKRGKVVSKKASAAGRRRYKSIESWTKAVKKAREALNLKGFVAIGGKTGQGKRCTRRPRLSSQGPPRRGVLALRRQGCLRGRHGADQPQNMLHRMCTGRKDCLPTEQIEL